MIRQNKNLKGININGSVTLLSQYADDTQLYLDGSEAVLEEALNVLDRFYLISGLKINVEKTQVVWIGSLVGSTARLCQDKQLDWVQNTFKVLGIVFFADVSNIWNFNYQSKMDELKRLLSVWKRRKLTLYGRICVVKSLAISKIIHLFTTLPKPPAYIMKELNTLFFHYIWKRPDKIKRNITVSEYKHGGLRMLNLDNFITALRVTWICRTLLDDRTWQQPFNQIITKYSLFWVAGANYTAKFKNQIENPFWKEIIEA